MTLAPQSIIPEPDVLAALRELLAQHPTMTQVGCEALSRALFVLRYLDRRPKPFEVETAREALLVDGEVLA